MAHLLESMPFRLLVEGPDDKWSIVNLLSKKGRTCPFIEVCEGYPNLQKKVNPILFKSMKRIGIVIDADIDLQTRWLSVASRLRSLGFTVPAAAPRGGWMGQDAGGVWCGVWVMPDNACPGILEDFLAHLVPEGDTCWQYAGAATDEAIRLGAPVPAVARSKAVIHAWLAWQDSPGRPFGQAITANVLTTEGELVNRFTDWFDLLFPAAALVCGV